MPAPGPREQPLCGLASVVVGPARSLGLLSLGCLSLSLALSLALACGGGDPSGQAFDPSDGPASTGPSASPTSGDTTAAISDASTDTPPVTTADDTLPATTSGDPLGSEGDDGTSTGVQNDCPRVRVEVPAGDTLNVRPDPSTNNPEIGSLAPGAIVDVLEEVGGQEIDGVDIWYHIQSPTLDGYVFSTFAACTLEEPPDLDPNGYYLPLSCGMTANVSQGNNGGTSHQGNSFYAFDFAIPLNTPLVAMGDGVVAYTFDETGPGDPCYDGGDSSCVNAANYVILRHADGTLTTYRHLNQVDVSVGDTVPLGSVVGLSGSTGYSTGRHAHVMRMGDCGAPFCQSIEMEFKDVGGTGIPQSGDSVTSGNCP